ncbi:hypothetical protein [Paraburkholderia sp. GAS32]|uniref:hypothetical protein n=1 Tax=Paraburkholderia sp. GAS32 TaxID=3035129 RepID=UPI003D237CA2
MATLDYASGRTMQKAVQRFAAQATLAELESMIHTMNGIARSLKYARSEILASGTTPATQPSDA